MTTSDSDEKARKWKFLPQPIVLPDRHMIQVIPPVRLTMAITLAHVQQHAGQQRQRRAAAAAAVSRRPLEAPAAEGPINLVRRRLHSRRPQSEMSRRSQVVVLRGQGNEIGILGVTAARLLSPISFSWVGSIPASVIDGGE